MSTAIERFDDGARRRVGAWGRTVVYEHELLRHPVYTRFLHWTVAIFFILSLLSGFAVYSPWVYHWIAPFYGTGARMRLLHPWFGLAFSVAFLFQFLNWAGQMTWTRDDRRWLDNVRDFVTNKQKVEPDYVGFFNAGQKLYFWAIVVSAVIFLVSGFPMWFPKTFGRPTVWVGYVLHDIAGLVMLGGFIVHLYEGTLAEPRTFQSMTRGTVTDRWAWTHHPAWYRSATGRNPKEDYERARERAARPPE